MRKLNKRIPAFLTAFIMALSMASCGSDSSSSSKASTDAVSSEVLSSADDSSYVAVERDYDPQITIDGTKFMVDGKEIWLNGANTPWDNWNDFGGSFEASFWDEHFQKLQDAGINCCRIWINCNGMIGVYLNEDGSFKNVTDKHWQDLDKLFELADAHGIYIMATLLSFDHFKDTNDNSDAWRNMIQSSENIDSFVDGYVIPFVKRYDDNDFLFSIDLMNEADWVYENLECGQIPWENISDYFARAAAGIHENSDVLVTSGLGMVKYNSAKYNGNMISDEYLQGLSGNKNSFMDYYSTHYYFWENPYFGFPFTESPLDFGLEEEKPCVIGECAALDESGVDLTKRYEDAYNNGWNGVFAWTSNGVDACGGYLDVAPATSNMLSLIEELIYPHEKTE